MRWSFCWLALLLSCTSVNHPKDNLAPSPVPTTAAGVISLDCHDQSFCSDWNKWLTELLNKSQKLKLPKSFKKHLAKNKKNFHDLLNDLNSLRISYSASNCLDGQVSCTFQGEEKIFFNSNAKYLTRIEWMGVFWHEVFHLLYPQIPHINCATCSDKKSRVYAECDQNSFSSYGLEQAWQKTYADKFISDKKDITKIKFILKNLQPRICQ